VRSAYVRGTRLLEIIPVYLSLQLAIRDWVLLLETHALSGFPPKDLENMSEGMRNAWDAVHRITYQIDLMSPLISHSRQICSKTL
jgi:hypothetical protein